MKSVIAYFLHMRKGCYFSNYPTMGIYGTKTMMQSARCIPIQLERARLGS